MLPALPVIHQSQLKYLKVTLWTGLGIESGPYLVLKMFLNIISAMWWSSVLISLDSARDTEAGTWGESWILSSPFPSSLQHNEGFPPAFVWAWEYQTLPKYSTWKKPIPLTQTTSAALHFRASRHRVHTGKFYRKDNWNFWVFQSNHFTCHFDCIVLNSMRSDNWAISSENKIIHAYIVKKL